MKLYSSLNISRYEPEWASHLPILARTLLVSTGPILEMGIGIYSTPLIHYFSLEQHRRVMSFEHDPQWQHAHIPWQNKYHTIELIDNWDTCPIEKYHWGIVFVDHESERRSIDAIRAARYADFVMLHDSNGRYEELYHYNRVYPFFKYHYDYNFVGHHTTVLSNFIPVHTIWTI